MKKVMSQGYKTVSFAEMKVCLQDLKERAKNHEIQDT